jgi:hypothetical protein
MYIVELSYLSKTLTFLKSSQKWYYINLKVPKLGAINIVSTPGAHPEINLKYIYLK